MKITLGPLQYYWPRERVLSFYGEMAALPLDTIYLGETVCARRNEMRLRDWLELAQTLRAGGREVVLSTQVLLEGEADVKALHRLVESGQRIEANDFGAVRALQGRGPFVAGSSLNVFHPGTLRFLAGLGADRWVVAPEIGGRELAAIQAGRPAGMQTEVLVHGRLPLAYSARCFTARRYNLQKDVCEFRCLEHPDGMIVRTKEQQEFLVLNGIQTQSARVHSLLGELPRLAQIGVDMVRVSPQSQGTARVIRAIREAIDHPEHSGGGGAPQEAATIAGTPCDGFWHSLPGMERSASGQDGAHAAAREQGA
jgi:collagenase-like PrtC family protease